MKPIDFFKLQSKNVFKDYKTQRPANEADPSYFGYDPKYFDINSLFLDYNINEEKFSLMNAQHLIAKLAGFSKWTEMLKVTTTQLELAKHLFDNMHKISAEEWDEYVFGIERENNSTLDPDLKLEIFQQVFANVDGHESRYPDYRLTPSEIHLPNIIAPRKIQNPGRQIASLPLSGEDRLEFIQTANDVFEEVLWRMESRYPELTQKLWNAELFIDNILLRKDMLPIDRDYAFSLIDAVLVHHVLDSAAVADKAAVELN